jgi:hypothetical protein
MYKKNKDFMLEKETIFVDRDMYGAIKAFDEYNRSLSFHTTISKLRNSNRFAKTLSRIFGNIKLNEISLPFVLEVLTSSDITDYESRDIMRFLIFLLEYSYVKDDILFRLTLFKGNEDNKENKKIQLDTISKLTKSRIKKILTCKNFQEYIDSGTLFTINSWVSHTGIQLFLIELPENSNIDSEMYECLLNYFEDIKLNTTLNVVTRLVQARAFVDIVKFFQNVAIKDITREYLYNVLKANEEIMISKKGRKTINQLHRVVLSIISRQLIKDNKLCHLANLDLHKGFSTETFLNILGNPNMDRYIQIPYPNKCNLNSLYYIDIQSNEVRNAFIEFVLTCSDRRGLVRICEEFDKSFGDYSIERIEDLDFNSYKAQLLYFSKYDEEAEGNWSCTARITAFYLFIKQNHNGKIFEKSSIDSNILQRTRIAQEILEGYKPIRYNPHERVPNTDKWLLCYSGLETDNGTELRSTTSTTTIDFTQVKSETYKGFCEHYLWYYNSGLHSKISRLNSIIAFCNYISDLKSGKVRYLGVTPTRDESITMNEVIAFKYHIMDIKNSNSSIQGSISIVSTFIKYISDHNFMNIEKGIFWHLENIPRSDKGTANAIADEDLNKVSTLMKEKANESIFNELCFFILYLAMHTPFRSSHIITWKVNAISETVKEGQFRIYSRTKTSHGQKLPIPITLRIQRVIEKAIKVTAPYRQECKNEKVKEFVFIVKSIKKGTYSNLSRARFNNYFKKCCEEVGVDPQYTFANLRDTRMSKAEVEVAKKGYSDMEQMALVQHRDPNSINNYSDIDIRECLEAVYQIYIGNVDVKGTVVKTIPKDIAIEEQSVSEGCGYCGNKICEDYSYLDCLVNCKHFWTSPEQIPFYKEQIKICDKKIAVATINHDKEDFQTIKRLMVAYLEKLTLIKEEANYEHISETR